MHGLEVATKQIDEGIEPLKGLYRFEKQEVVSVSETDVSLFVSQDGLAKVLVIRSVYYYIM